MSRDIDRRQLITSAGGAVLGSTFDVVSHLVYVTDEQDVASVVVDGKVLMRERDLLTIDTENITTEARRLAAKIQASLAERNRE